MRRIKEEKKWKKKYELIASTNFVNEIAERYSCLPKEEKMLLEEKLFDIEGQINKQMNQNKINLNSQNTGGEKKEAPIFTGRKKFRVGGKDDIKKEKEEQMRKDKLAQQILQDKLDKEALEKERRGTLDFIPFFFVSFSVFIIALLLYYYRKRIFISYVYFICLFPVILAVDVTYTHKLGASCSI